MKPKNPSKLPKTKIYSREQRIKIAISWIKNYRGKNLVKGYIKHFGVDLLCAIKELEIIGIKIEPEYIKQLKIQRLNQNKPIKNENELEIESFDSDDTFYYIMGYTSGGAPYGITREEIKKVRLEENNIKINNGD
jgi:hypothetical protein